MILYFYITELLNSEKNPKVKDQNFGIIDDAKEFIQKNSESFLDFSIYHHIIIIFLVAYYNLYYLNSY